MLFKKRNMNKAIVLLFTSSKGKTANLKRGQVWSVNVFENVIILMIFFCNLLTDCNLVVCVCVCVSLLVVTITKIWVNQCII